MSISLKDIYKPRKEQLKFTDKILKSALSQIRDKGIFKINHYLLASGGKKLRLVLALICSEVVFGRESNFQDKKLGKINSYRVFNP